MPGCLVLYNMTVSMNTGTWILKCCFCFEIMFLPCVLLVKFRDVSGSLKNVETWVQWARVSKLQRSLHGHLQLKTSTFVISGSATWKLVIQCRSLIPFCYATCIYIAECWFNGSNGQATIWILEWLPRTCLEPQAVFACPCTELAFSKTVRGKELGISIQMLVSVPQTRWWQV